MSEVANIAQLIEKECETVEINANNNGKTRKRGMKTRKNSRRGRKPSKRTRKSTSKRGRSVGRKKSKKSKSSKRGMCWTNEPHTPDWKKLNLNEWFWKTVERKLNLDNGQEILFTEIENIRELNYQKRPKKIILQFFKYITIILVKSK